MPKSISSLGGNLRVALVGAYGDGTIHARLEDEHGRGTEVCIDGRKNSPTRYRRFEQARHPNKQGAVLIDLGAPEEGIVVPLISRWLDSDEARRWFTEMGFEKVRDTLTRLGELA
jgi:hypothetical protein